MFRTFTTSLLCCALMVASGQAVAGEAHSPRAESLMRQGQSLLDAGKADAACVKFESSEAAEHSVATLLKLGDCYVHAGRNASAWHSFSEAGAFAHVGNDSQSEQTAKERVAELEPKLSRVVFVVPETSRVSSLSIRLGENTIPASAWGAIIPVDSGVQHISASAKGHESWSVDVTVTSGDAQEYRVSVPALAPMAGTQATNNHRSAYRTAGFVAGGVGAAGLGASAVLTALARNDDANTCTRGVIQCSPDQTSHSSANNNKNSNAAAVSLAVGGTLLATGITLVVLAPAPDNKEAHALRVAARYAAGGGRLQLEGVW